MIWREMRQSGEIFERIPKIWEHERSMPRWYQDASKVWVKTIEDQVSFVELCEATWGLFDNDKLVVCIYFEKENVRREVEIHLSVLRKIKPSVFMEECAKLRDQLFHKGTRRVRGWIMNRNTALCKLLLGVGFRETGLRMDKGRSHGKVLSWKLVEVTCG